MMETDLQTCHSAEAFLRMKILFKHKVQVDKNSPVLMLKAGLKND